MKLQLLGLAEADLVDGFRFYEMLEPGLGARFLCGVLARRAWRGASVGSTRLPPASAEDPGPSGSTRVTERVSQTHVTARATPS